MTDEDTNAIASAIMDAARHLGTGNAATPMGALEALAAVHEEGLKRLATYISESNEQIATAISELAIAVSDVNKTIQTIAISELKSKQQATFKRWLKEDDEAHHD